MTSLWAATRDFTVRLIAQAASGPSFLANGVRTATLSVARVLAQLWSMGIAEDIRKLKDDGLRRSSAKADVEEARARKVLAEAVEIENKAALSRRNDRISKAEAQLRLAEAAKTLADAEAIRLKAQSEQQRAIAEAQVSLIDAISRLRQQGGSVAINPQNLAALLGVDVKLLEAGLTENGNSGPSTFDAEKTDHPSK